MRGIKIRVYKQDCSGLNSIELLSTKYRCVEEIDDCLKGFPITGESEIVDLAEVTDYALNKISLLNRVKANALEIDDRCAIERTYGINQDFIIPNRVAEVDESILKAVYTQDDEE